MHIVCTICSDLLNQAESIYVTKCGHIFHHHCLAQWIERSKTCPQCRNKVTEKCMFRVYPTISNEGNAQDAATLQSQLDDLTLQLRQQKATNQAKDEKLEALMADVKNTTELVRNYEKKLVSRESAVTALKEQLDYVKIQNKETNRLKEENESLHKNLQTLHSLQKVLNATADEVERMLESYTDLRTIALFATSLKRALVDCEARKNEYRNEVHEIKQQLSGEKTLVGQMRLTVARLEDRLSTMTHKYEALKKRKASETPDRSVKGTAAKQARHETSDLNTAMLAESNTSISAMVDRIENADSPYLQLKQGNLALSMMHRQQNEYGDNRIKPSELAIINAARKQFNSSNPLSIFHKKEPLKPDPGKAEKLGYYYDGLGGHSKVETFPTPKQRPAYIPKVTAKHRLKRPAAAAPGSQDISELFGKLSQDKNS